MATTTEEFLSTTVSGGKSLDFQTEYINETDIKVRVDGGQPLTFTNSTTPNTGEYHIPNNGTTITFGDDQSGKSIHVYSETKVTAPTVTFRAGSSIKAADLNALEGLVRHGIQESRNDIVEHNIRDGSITSAKIKDGTIVDADINTNAAIGLSKLATGALPTGITVNTDNIVNGTIKDEDVSISANIQGSKLLDDSVALTKLGGGPLPTDITVTGDNVIERSIKEGDIEVGALDNRYYTENELDAGQLDNRYYTENELDGGQLDNRYYIESELDGGVLDQRYYTKSDLDGGQLNTLYYTESELDQGAIDGRYYTETELDGGQLDTRYYTETELNGGQLDDQYFQESELLNGALDGRYFTETEIANGAADTRYYTEAELDAGQLDTRYYTETESEALFLRQDSSETLASGQTWSNSDAFVATTAAINARIIDLVDEVGGFTVIADELNFPNTNPQGATGQAAILSIGALTTGYTRTGTDVSIANGTVAISSGPDAPGNRTVTIKNVPLDLPSGFGLLVESTATLDEYTFHRLVPIATQVNTVAQNIINIVAAGANVVDINNFADLYQISANPPSQRVDGTSLQSGDLWFDNSNGNLRVWDGSNWAIITPAQSVLNDIAIVSGAITYAEDLGLISDPVTVGTSNGSLDIVADALEDEISFTVTAAGGAFVIDGDSKPALTLYKGWTYTFDVSDASNATHPFRFYAGSSQYSTEVLVYGTQGQAGAKVSIKIPETQPTNFQYYCTNHSGMGNTITVKDDPIKTVSDNVDKIIAAANNQTNVNAVQANQTNINAVAANESNINAVKNNETNINAVNANKTNIDAVAANESNITAVATNATNINAVKNNESNINAVNANASDISAVAGNNSNVTKVADNETNINAVKNNESNINSAVTNASNINSAVSNAANINTVAANIADVNNFADQYQVASSNPSTDGGGNALSAGDLYFNSSSKELRIYNGTSWQGGVTATGNLAGLGANTFSGNQTINANIVISGTVDGRDVATDGTKLDGIEDNATRDQTASEIIALINGNTISPNVINTHSLTLDFGTL